jgi:lysophospholipase L1-like esterase
MIDQIRKNGAAVLLVGIQSGLFQDTYKKEFETLAKEKQVSFVPNILEDIFGNPKLMADEIHPNDQGYALMAERILPLLRKMLE